MSTRSPRSKANRMRPSVGRYAPTTHRDTVVLPQPLSPTKARVSLRPSPNDTSPTARTKPTAFRDSPLRIGNLLLKFSTVRRGDIPSTFRPPPLRGGNEPGKRPMRARPAPPHHTHPR